MELLTPLDKTAFPTYTATAGSAAGNTTAWSPGPQGVVVWCDQACYVEVGVAATATTSSMAIPAYTPVPFTVPLNTTGAPWRVSVLRIGSTDGTAYCKPINRQ